MPLRSVIRDLVPRRFGVPLRFAFNAAMGQLDREMRLIGTSVLPVRRRAIDVGANFGLYTYALARRAAYVEAFEPVPACAEFIRGWGNPAVKVHEVALSDREGQALLHVPIATGKPAPALASLGAATGEAQDIGVRLTTLDHFRFDDVDFIKIDVEGHELSVLRGARQTIERCKPGLIVEIEQRHLDRTGGQMREVFNFFEALSYDAFFVAPDRAATLRPITEFSYERHQRSQLANVDDPSYINNFAFVPRSPSVAH